MAPHLPASGHHDTIKTDTALSEIREVMNRAVAGWRRATQGFRRRERHISS
jgi:hypothetical protein